MLVLSQHITFTVLAEANSTPINGVFVIQNDTILGSTDEKGNFTIYSDPALEHIYLKHISFEEKKVHKNLLEGGVIYLQEKSNVLSEILIETSKVKLEDIFQKKALLNFSRIVRSGKPSFSSHIALFIPKEKTGNFIIKSLYVKPTLGYWDKKTQIRYLPFRVNLYSVDSVSFLPGNKIIEDGILTQKSAGDELVTVDVSQYDIKFPNDGIFVVVELLERKDSYNDRPAFEAVLPSKNSAFKSYIKVDPGGEGDFAEWKQVSYYDITYSYDFGIQIQKTD